MLDGDRRHDGSGRAREGETSRLVASAKHQPRVTSQALRLGCRWAAGAQSLKRSGGTFVRAGHAQAEHARASHTCCLPIVSLSATGGNRQGQRITGGWAFSKLWRGTLSPNGHKQHPGLGWFQSKDSQIQQLPCISTITCVVAPCEAAPLSDRG